MVGGDEIEGDKVTIGDINKSAVAIGDGATAIQRALSAVEVADQAEEQAYRRLKEALTIHEQGLGEQAKRARDQAAHATPYRALLSYDLQDAPIFFGRDENCDELMRALDKGRLTVLYAESGAGKTSLLKAGLMSRLIARENVPVYLRPRDVPVPLRLKSFLLPALDETPVLADDSLRDFLVRATKLLPGRELVVLVDQFEDVFDLQGDEVRADFGKQLAECLDDETLRVRWVLALRQEYFVRLGEFRQIKEPFGNVVPLPRMTREQAQAVIVEPSRLRGVTWEQDVVDRVLAELAADDPGILPVQLQLVCAELFQRAGKDGDITLEDYKDAGAVHGILGSYLNNVLERQMAPGQRKVARQLLENLAASEPGMRLSKGALAELLRGHAIDGNTTDEVLKQLQDAFLVRIEEADGRETVELAHRYLLGQLKPDDATREAVAAKKLLERWVQEYDEKGMLLDADRLALIEIQWDKLGVADDSRAAELRKKSADKLKLQRGYVRWGIGAVLILATAALLSVVGLGVARTETRNFEATAQAVQTVAADAQVVARTAGATAQVAEAVAADARATQIAAEAAASDAEARAEIAAATLRRAFQQTGVVPVADGPVALAWDGTSLWVANAGSDTIQQIDPVTGAVEVTVSVGREPRALIWDGSHLWVANFGDNTVQQIDPKTRKAEAPIRVGEGPAALAWDDSRLWVANRDENTLQSLDPTTGIVGEPVTVGDLPVALAWDGNRLWVANWGDNTVQRIDPSTGVSEESIPVGKRPGSLAWDGNRLWVAHDLISYILSIDTATGTTGDWIDFGGLPSGLAWDGSSLWVADSVDNTVQQVDPAVGIVGEPIAVGHEPAPLAWDGKHLWVANWGDNTVQRIDPSLGAIGTPVSVGGGPTALAWSHTGLWVATGPDGSVQQVDPVTGAVGEPITVGEWPAALAWDGNRLWVANESDDTVQSLDPVTGAVGEPIAVGHAPAALAWDGNHLWVVNTLDDTVQQIDPVTGAIGTPIRVGDGPVVLVWDGNRLWVANRDENTLQLLDPVTGAVGEPIAVGHEPAALAWDGNHLWVANRDDNTVQQIDPSTGSTGTPIPVGDAPWALAWDGTSLWVANGSDNTVQQIDPATGAVGAPIRAGRRTPSALVSDGRSLWMADYYDGTVWHINARSLNLIWRARRLAQKEGSP